MLGADYFCFKINKKNFISNEDSFFDLWYKLCEVYAFKKFYILIKSNKEINIYKILITVFIIILGIPIRVLKLTFNFLKYIKIGNTPLRSLYLCYLNEFILIDGKKIELFFGDVYINGSVELNIIISKISSYIKTKDIQVLFQEYKNLQKICLDLNKQEQNIKKPIFFEKTKLKIGNWVDSKGHFSYILDRKQTDFIKSYNNIKDNQKNILVHATSKKPSILSTEQIISEPIQSLILEEAIDPVTIYNLDYSIISKNCIGKVCNSWELSYNIKKIAPSYDDKDLLWVYKKEDIYSNHIKSVVKQYNNHNDTNKIKEENWYTNPIIKKYEDIDTNSIIKKYEDILIEDLVSNKYLKTFLNHDDYDVIISIEEYVEQML